MLKKVIKNLSRLTLANAARDDDIVDQLHHHAMVATLLLMGVAVTGRQFVGNPIHCWVPAQYSEDDQQDYINSVCWISQIYNVPFSEEMPVSKEERMSDARDVSFYRWAAVILFVQAAMFELPHLVWRSLKGLSGVNVKKIVTMCNECQALSADKSSKHVSDIAHFIQRWLQTYRRHRRGLYNLPSFFNKRTGTFLVHLYLFIKLLYLLNVLLQFHLISVFLGFNFWKYGADVVGFLSDETHWSDLDHFPRIGMCDVKIRQMQNLQDFTIQCVLSGNLFLEKIFAGEWFVFVFLAGITVLNTVHWFAEEMLTSRRERFLDKYLYMIKEERKRFGQEGPDTILFKKFVRRYLRCDGVFLLRMVSRNTNDIITFDLLKQLWISYEKEHTPDENGFNSQISPSNGLRKREVTV